MRLSDVKGQSRALRMLESARRRGRLASTYLFAGEEGIGKRTAAVAFAASLNCAAPEERGGLTDACGHCHSCVKMASGSHPDFILLEPDGAQIKVEQVREVEDALSFKSFEGGMKTIVVDNADAMNQAAANAFLKTLEEPAPQSLIILISSMPDVLPATIRSRASRINFRPLSDALCREALPDRAQYPDAVVRMAMGRPGLAASEDLVAGRDGFLESLDTMLAGGKAAWKEREDMERWLDMAMIMLRDMAVLKTEGPVSASLINPDMADELTEMGSRASVEGIIDCYTKIRQLRAAMGFNLNKSITWNYAASLMGALRIHAHQ